jgi:hypothetical protein
MEHIVSEIWSELKRYINSVDRSEAADIVVSVMVDNDCAIDDIRDAFKGDSDIKRALTDYMDQGHDEGSEEEEEEELDYDEEDWEN